MDKILLKLLIVVLLIVGWGLWFHYSNVDNESNSTSLALKQFNEKDAGKIQKDISHTHWYNNTSYVLVWLAIGILTIFMFKGDIYNMFKRFGWIAVFCLVIFSGCRKPFEPVKLEVISSTEEAFLIPFKEGIDEQVSSKSKEFLKENMVYAKQVKIPQQWVPTGYETVIWDGEWRDAAILIKVDTSPVTREWTADENTGSSNKNEAIWVMTSDQVEFSTGWTCTARIASKDDAVKFLHNYPNGSLAKVMDTEVRARLQAEFGLEVTDLPMEELRKAATPHIVKVTKSVTEFFAERGITITNLGITGGFVYKDPSVVKMMIEVFNSEQKKSIAAAEVAAQNEINKKVQLEAEAKAKAVMTAAKAEADAIKLIADAKNYEIEKAKTNEGTYLGLKQIELEKLKLEKWDGKFPMYFMGTSNPNMLLQVPTTIKGDK